MTGPRLLVTIGVLVACSVLSEFALAFVESGPLERLGPIGRLLFGAEHIAPLPTWGGMLADGRSLSGRAPWLAFFPGVSLLVLAVGIVLLASGLADLLKLRIRLIAQRQPR